MSDQTTETTKLTIRVVNGGDPADRDNLMDCYFEAQGSQDVYQFFGAGDNHIATIPEFLTVDTPGFQFIRAGMLWTVTGFDIDQRNQTANGLWRNPRRPRTGDDEGHFQAQAGPPIMESASSANA
jgi:hypothetical protein